MSSSLTDEELPGYARIHCRTERALFHAGHLRRLFELAGMSIPSELVGSNGFFAVHEDQMDPILEAIEKQKRKAKFRVIPGGKTE